MGDNELIKETKCNSAFDNVQVDEYLKRVDRRIHWYDSKREFNKICYISFKLIALSASALIPLVIGLNIAENINKIITASLGFISTIAAGTLSLLKFHEGWIGYSRTTNSLRKEKWLFLTKCSDYKDENAFCIFVNKIESIISNENLNWANYISNDQEPKNKVDEEV